VSPHSNIRFLQEKIQDLKSALFFSQNSSLLRMPTTVVSILKADDLGQVWFLVPRPSQALQEFDREFHVRLEFFRKGMCYFLHVSGRAFIINDPEEINSLFCEDEDIRKMLADHLVLIKVKMTKADYFDTAPPHSAGWWQDWRKQMHAWLFNTRKGYKPYHLEPATMVTY
jgi:general stress protein 26